MLYFAGWDLYGNMSWMFATQGINVLLNMFFGAVINASSSIAFQVRNVVSGFSNNITTAVSPQIIKSYANNDLIYMNKLIIQSAKFSFLLLYLISLPLIIENEFILNLWLKDVPKYTKEFCQLNLIYGLISALFYPVITGIYAVGEMKRVSFITGTIYLISLPITYTLLKLNYSPLTPFIVSIFILLFACLYNQTIIKKYVKSYSISYFFKEVVFKCLTVVMFSSITPLTLSILLTQGWVRLILVGLGSTSSVAITTYYIAIDEKLQHKVVFKIKNSLQYFYEVICYRLTIKI
jgi:O-antigen/teichoic acid export membrane protein